VSKEPAVAAGDVLTGEQARRLLALPKSTFYGLIAAGHLPHCRIPSPTGGRGAIRVLRSDVAAFLERARQAAPRAPVAPDVDALLAKVRRGGG
jgi:excisionase family DNA binding protein